MKIQQLKNKTEKGTGGLARHGLLSWPPQKHTLPLSDMLGRLAEVAEIELQHIDLCYPAVGKIIDKANQKH